MSQVKERVKLNQGLKEAPRDEGKKEEEEEDDGYSEEEFEQFNEEDDEEAKHFKRIKNALKKENVNARRKNDISHNNSGVRHVSLLIKMFFVSLGSSSKVLRVGHLVSSRLRLVRVPQRVALMREWALIAVLYCTRKWTLERKQSRRSACASCVQSSI